MKYVQIDVRSENAKKFMSMFNKGEIPEGISATDRYQVFYRAGQRSVNKRQLLKINGKFRKNADENK